MTDGGAPVNAGHFRSVRRPGIALSVGHGIATETAESPSVLSLRWAKCNPQTRKFIGILIRGMDVSSNGRECWRISRRQTGRSRRASRTERGFNREKRDFRRGRNKSATKRPRSGTSHRCLAVAARSLETRHARDARLSRISTAISPRSDRGLFFCANSNRAAGRGSRDPGRSGARLKQVATDSSSNAPTMPGRQAK